LCKDLNEEWDTVAQNAKEMGVAIIRIKEIIK
jgi:hypothetical protein